MIRAPVFLVGGVGTTRGSIRFAVVVLPPWLSVSRIAGGSVLRTFAILAVVAFGLCGLVPAICFLFVRGAAGAPRIPVFLLL